MARQRASALVVADHPPTSARRWTTEVNGSLGPPLQDWLSSRPNLRRPRFERSSPEVRLLESRAEFLGIAQEGVGNRDRASHDSSGLRIRSCDSSGGECFSLAP